MFPIDVGEFHTIPVFYSFSDLSLLFQGQYPLLNMTSTVLCDTSGVSPEMVQGKALVVMRGDCEFSQKAQVAQRLGATALLIASNKSLVGQRIWVF